MTTTLDEHLPDDVACAIGTNRHGRYCVPVALRHRPVARAILSGEVWEPKVLDLLAAHPACDIVHAGAFFGDFLPALARSRKHGARVWAFEPSAENFACARSTVRLNDLDSVELVNAGLGERAEERLLSSRRGGKSLGGWCTFSDTAATDGLPAPGPGSELARVVTIDEVVPGDRHVGAIQLDVEGFEGPALRGGLRTITRCRPVLVIESAPGFDVLDQDWFREQILGLGYEKIGYLHENVVLFPT
ncbi:MAG: FkbM family methyltransferase [Myxococcota bacterium]